MAKRQRPWIGSSLPAVGMVSAVVALAVNQIIGKMAMSKGTSFYILSVYSNGLATLFLFPTAFLFHRSKRPKMSFPVMWRIFLLASFGKHVSAINFIFPSHENKKLIKFIKSVARCFAEIGSYAGINYSSPTLSTAMLILVPAFTYLLAIFFRMEDVNFKRFSTIAKSLGTLVSITGAFIVTFYKGPAILNSPLTSGSFTKLYLPSSQNWVLGGFLLACASFMTASWCILQASILKMYPAEMIIVAFYCLFVTMQSSLVTLVAERDMAALRIETKIGLMAIFYAVSKYYDYYSHLYLKRILIGALVLILGFYVVMWGKAKERDMNLEVESPSYRAPLLQDYNIREA
ncbi:nodulin MtN21 /EamA-like transporter family protein [Striga asiatica]|uniref:Nodulin MtN21 /EamA-like transporter family protein n=1 Tax=Striga asiatica TaxID=4170 RepID=A0A5A7RE07_STRAF|nr:nodulin MtN21 /EamA-like transporter family protein [Striga asiatica]